MQRRARRLARRSILTKHDSTTSGRRRWFYPGYCTRREGYCWLRACARGCLRASNRTSEAWATQARAGLAVASRTRLRAARSRRAVGSHPDHHRPLVASTGWLRAVAACWHARASGVSAPSAPPRHPPSSPAHASAASGTRCAPNASAPIS
eukprot:6214684-Pleurochrysis_carterae.AAC.2